MTYLIAFAVLFGPLDRLWGSKLKIYGRSGHSLGVVGALLAAGAAYYFINPYAAAMCALWPLYRCLNNSGGAMAPKGTAQALVALGRHLIAAGLMCAVLGVQHQGLTLQMLYPLAYALIATGLAIFNGDSDGEVNWAVELVRGTVYGGCAALALGVL